MGAGRGVSRDKGEGVQAGAATERGVVERFVAWWFSGWEAYGGASGGGGAEGLVGVSRVAQEGREEEAPSGEVIDAAW